MGTCTVCDALTRTKYCSEACKQKAYRSRLTPEQLADRKAANAARHRRWVEANPERERENTRRWQAANREKTRVNARRFAAANPGYGRVNTLRRVFGLTVERYDEMHLAQGGVCAACGQAETSLHQSGNVRRLAVDHDHTTKAVRGLLCHNCNIGVGHFKDDPARLDAAAAYLRRYV